MAKKPPNLVTLFLRRAKARKEDADVLFEAGRTTGAVYLAGYAVECGLKAVVLSLLPASQRPGQEAEFRGNRAHDFGWLRALGQTLGGSQPPGRCRPGVHGRRRVDHRPPIRAKPSLRGVGRLLRRGGPYHAVGRAEGELMAVNVPRGPGRSQDAVLDQVAVALERYQEDHPRAVIDMYRQGRYSVRVRVIDPTFLGLRRGARHERVWEYLGTLPEEVFGEVHTLLPLTPDEQPESAGNFEFDHPVTWDGVLGLSITGASRSFGTANGGGLSITGGPPAETAIPGPPTP